MDILVNGTSVAWQNVNVTILGYRINGITKVEYKRTGNHTANYGAGNEPISYGFGNYTYTASIEIYQEEWQKIYQLSGGNPQSLLPFDISIDFIPTDDSIVSPYTDVLYNVKFLESGVTVSQGDQKIMVQIPLLLSGIAQFR